MVFMSGAVTFLLVEASLNPTFVDFSWLSMLAASGAMLCTRGGGLAYAFYVADACQYAVTCWKACPKVKHMQPYISRIEGAEANLQWSKGDPIVGKGAKVWVIIP